MRKIVILIIICAALAPALKAGKITNEVFLSSQFIKDDILLTTPVAGRLSGGVEASFVKHDIFDDPNFFAALPMIMDYDLFKLQLKPFGMPQTNDLYAYGASFDMLLYMEKNDITDKFTQSRVSINYVNQKADIYGPAGVRRDDCGEINYGLSLQRNFYNAFVFGANAGIYQYLNGIKDVRAVRSIFNQNDFSNLNNYDAVYDLPKYTAGAVFNRMLEHGANIYLSYSYTEFYTADYEHSIILGNDFPLARAVKADLGYNHIITGGGDKKDIFKIALNIEF